MTKHLLRSFAGGEVTPELAGRLDLVKYQTGLALCRNFITLPHGPAVRRPGFRFINECGDSTKKVRLVPFNFSATQTAVVEFGHQYIRFHTNGGTVLETAQNIGSIVTGTVTITAHGYVTGDWVYIGTRYHKVVKTGNDTFTTTDLWGSTTTPSGATAARVYTISSPYTESDLFDIHFAQSADVITLTHPSYAVRELRRLAASSWELSTVSFAAPAGVPTGVTVTATVASDQNKTKTYYVVTGVKEDGVTETLPSVPAYGTNNLSLAGNFNKIKWNAINGYGRYNVYKLRGGAYGYIGQISADSAGTPLTISSATPYNPLFGTNRNVRIVTSTAHGFTTSNSVVIAGTTYFDGTYTVTVENTTTFTYSKSTTGAPTVNTGTAAITTLELVDDNVQADTTQTPPDEIILLNKKAGDYPATSVYHEQRRWFAGTNDKPQVLWATRTGTDDNLTSSIPTRDADGMELRVASSQYNQIRHLMALADLIALTAGGEFRIYAEGAPAITATSVSIKPQGYAGASNVQPVVTMGSILYVQAQGSRVRELAYNWEANAYRSTDTSMMAPHRFNGYTISDLAYSRAPESICWAVRNDGKLLGMTYVPDQQVYGWHAHDTDGVFESVAVVAEANEDVLYAVVKRTVNSRTVRYIERLDTRVFTAAADAYFVDAGLTYSGSPTSAVTGLWHLEGKSVDILADGAVRPRATVTNGQITLATPASKIHVGLPITADLQTLPLAIEGMQAVGQGAMKNVNRVHLRVASSSVVKVGPTFDRLRDYPSRSALDPYAAAPTLRTGEVSLTVDPSWNTDAAVCIRQDLPLGLNIMSMTLDIASGG